MTLVGGGFSDMLQRAERDDADISITIPQSRLGRLRWNVWRKWYLQRLKRAARLVKKGRLSPALYGTLVIDAMERFYARSEHRRYAPPIRGREYSHPELLVRVGRLVFGADWLQDDRHTDIGAARHVYGPYDQLVTLLGPSNPRAEDTIAVTWNDIHEAGLPAARRQSTRRYQLAKRIEEPLAQLKRDFPTLMNMAGALALALVTAILGYIVGLHHR